MGVETVGGVGANIAADCSAGDRSIATQYNQDEASWRQEIHVKYQLNNSRE